MLRASAHEHESPAIRDHRFSAMRASVHEHKSPSMRDRRFPAMRASAQEHKSPVMRDRRFPEEHVSRRTKATLGSKLASASHSSALSLSPPTLSSHMRPATFTVSAFTSVGDDGNQTCSSRATSRFGNSCEYLLVHPLINVWRPWS
jgi:hypothetical protein